ncbi:fumarylacetoacetate hydrolase family protein [Sinomonas notoginsengisoli]|uniref:fumarylacetoacetate hydrolase family protein n=1 Tax=Sinomonas notoginsengisoli TaxID=1457311 RepID=UPI001F478A6C|nr:fumarylacetoacetate hydrolase family protein [Sinomonas notoginsengisoli]
MRIARCVNISSEDSAPFYGVVQGEPGRETVAAIKGDPFFNGVEPTGETHSLDDVRLLAPIIPRSKIVGIGRNYSDHAKEMGNDLPTEPSMFLVANTAVVGPGDPVVLPEWTEEVSYEGELCIVIGRICKDVPAERVPDVIFGYTVGNDLTARDKQRADLQWARAKSFDTSKPLGPWIETELDVEDLRLTTKLNGVVKQDGTTADMVFGVNELVAAASSAFTLLPGDVIMTGTPAGVGLVKEGDRVEVEIECLGTLANPVVRR